MRIRGATTDDLEWILRLASMHKHELGFVRRVSLENAIDRGTLLVIDGGHGFCEYYRRRDGWASVYAIVSVVPGGGRALMDAIARPIRLSCPEDLAANGFYAHIGGHNVAIVNGKKRRLREWHWYANDTSVTLQQKMSL